MIGTVLSARYALLEEIGRGGMGIVYRAHDPLLDRRVAVKMIPPEVFSVAAEERFRDEARLIAQMDHPAIVPIYDLGRHQGNFFYVMPLIEGKTLRELLRGGTLRLGEILEILAQAAEALAHSHEQGVVHRDIKPENLMASIERGTGPRSTARVWVMDFGLAREIREGTWSGSGAESDGGDGGVLRGTALYMSPERIHGEAVGPPSDLFALGVVLYECLAGEPPFRGKTALKVVYQILNEEPRGLRDRGLEIDPALEDLVQRCLAKDPAERPSDGRVLAADLRRLNAAQALEIRARPLVPSVAALRVAHTVGREIELRRLFDELAEVSRGGARWILLDGDAGVGKTRLLEDFARQAALRGACVLQGRVDDRGALPLQGLCELIRDACRKHPEVVPELSDLALDLTSWFPTLREVEELRRVATEASGIWLPTDTEPEPVVFHELLARVLGRFGEGRSQVLLLENLHDGDATLEALDYLVRRLGSRPLLVVGTFRRDLLSADHRLHRMSAAAASDPRLIPWTLEPLRREGLISLIGQLLGGEPSAAVVETFVDATAGNPFFVQELARALREQGVLGRVGASVDWLLEGSAADLLPATIQQTVESRLEHLSREERLLLEVAAALGRSFSEGELEDAAVVAAEMAPTVVDAALDALVERQWLLEVAERELSFPSGIVREVIERGMPRRRRRRLHQRLGELLEERWEGSHEDALPRLVEHFRAADMPEKAVLYTLDRARFALSAQRLTEAVEAARLGLELADDGAFALRGELHEILARVSRRRGELEFAAREAAAAVQADLDGGKIARGATAALLAAEIAWQNRDLAAARRWIVEAEGLSRRGGVGRAPRRRVYTLGVRLATLEGDPHGAAVFRDALAELDDEDRGSDLPPPRHRVLRAALAQTVGSLDPARLLTAEEFEIAACVFETLLATDVDGAVVPGLAEGWTGNRSQRRFELVLRGDVVFSDGAPLTAEAVSDSLTRAARLCGDRSVPALRCLAGWRELVDGETDRLAGIEVLGERRIVFHLSDELPIFPAFLTNLKTAVMRRRPADGALVGTGPFVLERADADHLLLRRNALSARPPTGLDGIEMRVLGSSAMAAALRRGEIDLARDFSPADLEVLLREPRLRAGWIETTRKNVTFLLWNQRGPSGRSPELRRALTGVLRVADLVWRSLGRLAQPATSLIPPGIFAHDPDRRRAALSTDAAARLLETVDASLPRRLRVAAHPLFHDRYGAVLEALRAEWKPLGISLDIPPTTMETFRTEINQVEGVDLLLMRWIADYDDPDNFTDELFHSVRGFFRSYLNLPEADVLLDRARRRAEPIERRALYRRFEDLVAEEAVLLPLFYDIDYRLAGPRVRGLSLQNTPPYVGYRTIELVEPAGAPEEFAASSR